MLGYLSADIICSEKRTDSERIARGNCERRGTDTVQRQISEHTVALNKSHCVCHPSNLIRNACSLENWGIYIQ